MITTKRIIAALLFFISAMAVEAQGIVGKVIDKSDKSPLAGATVQVEGTKAMAVTDVDGNFKLTGLKAGNCRLTVKYISYKTTTVGHTVKSDPSETDSVVIALVPDEQVLKEVAVTGLARRNTDVAMLQVARNSSVIVSNISAQEIKRTQDSNAGEVIRRVPGVSIIEGKFVMVRGLSQRYNNVWVNGGATPSSEADSRAFSFDLIPSSQLDNMQIIKTPSPEYPADYSGGFILINTKDIPSENTVDIQVGASWNDATAFSSFLYGKGSSTDFLGFDGGLRRLNGGMNAKLSTIASGINLAGNGLNNDWSVKSMNPLGDLKLAANLGRRWKIGEQQLGMIAALNYTNEYRRYIDMENNLFGVYNTQTDNSVYFRKSYDDQYNHNVRLGAMLNFTMLSPSGNNKYQLKNIFNQIGNDRYTWRTGIDAQDNNEESAEYYYRSRTTYNGQLTGKHTVGDKDVIDWSASYSYANRDMPDRRRYVMNDQNNSEGIIEWSAANDTHREWTRLDEHIVSATLNEDHKFVFGSWEPSLKAGAYAEYRTRKYNTRQFYYGWNESSSLIDKFQSNDITSTLSNPDYYGADKLFLIEDVNKLNDYKGNSTIGAGYFAATLPVGNLSIYAGLRYEYSNTELITNTRKDKDSPRSHRYEYNDLFPSINATYKLNEDNQIRASYGKSVNRPEFRELSPSVFYDFDLASNVEGNSQLKPCYIQNVDLRYEFYPSKGEVISLAAFYKHFDAPIESTYTLEGGNGYTYSFNNAKSAYSYGLELDIRKDLSFIGLRGLSWSFNGSLIKSRVQFEKGSTNRDRTMQGQSPYLVNTGLFYKNDKAQWEISALYNRIGKRIIGVGRYAGTAGDVTLNVPDSYEMPRDVIDISASKRFGSHWEIKLSVRDLLAQKVFYKQFVEAHYSDGHSREITQVTRSFKPGRNFGLSAIYKF